MTKLFTKLIALILTISLCFAFVSCTGTGTTTDNNDDGKNNNNETKISEAYVEIEINPSIELTVNEEGNVVSVFGTNDDAKVLLYEEDSKIVGKNYEEAISYITKLAIELGYLNEENSDFSTTVISANAADAESIKDKIDAKIVSTADGMGVTASLDLETAFSLLAELEEFKSENPNSAAIQALTPEKYKLAVSASKNGEITLEAAAELSDEALIEEVKKAHATIESYAVDSYLEAKARANALFESSMGVLYDGIYTTIYASRVPYILSNPAYLNTLHYGASYQAYKTSARTYAAVVEIMKFASDCTSLSIPEKSVNEIALALGITDTTPLKDKNGNVTLDSVILYCNEYMKTHEVSEELKAGANEAIDVAKDAAELVAISSDMYEQDLNALKTAIQGVITSGSTISSTILPFLPEDAKAEFEVCLADLDKTYDNLTKIIEEGDTSDSVVELSRESEEKAKAFLEKINADLTEEEKATAKTMEANLSTSIQNLTSEFNARLTAAEADAKKYLSDKRAERTNQN